MLTIERYLMEQIFLGLLVAAAILLPLFSFLDLLEQLDDVGEGFYTVQDAFVYVILLLPRRLIQLAPFIALLGNVVALGRLAINQELITMRAAGMSPARISASSLKVGLLLLLILAILEQFIAPPLQHDALMRRSQALEQSTELGKGLGVWSKDQKYMLRIGEPGSIYRMEEVEIFLFKEDGLLERYIRADYANIINDAEWILRNVTLKTIGNLDISSRTIEAMEWRPFLDAEQIATLTRPPESLSPQELYQYINYLRETDQQDDPYTLALWRKLGGGLITIAMMLLSVPFVFGSVRTGVAYRLVLAGLTGLCVYLLDQIVSNVGLLLGLSFPIVALAPGLILLIIAKLWLDKFT